MFPLELKDGHHLLVGEHFHMEPATQTELHELACYCRTGAYTVNLKGIASTRYSKYRLFRAQFLVVSWDGDQSEATHGRCNSRQAIERRVNVCTHRAKTGTTATSSRTHPIQSLIGARINCNRFLAPYAFDMVDAIVVPCEHPDVSLLQCSTPHSHRVDCLSIASKPTRLNPKAMVNAQNSLYFPLLITQKRPHLNLAA